MLRQLLRKRLKLKKRFELCLRNSARRQLLNMNVPVSQNSKNKASKDEKARLDFKRSFSYILGKVKKKEIRKVLTLGELFLNYFLIRGVSLLGGAGERLRSHGG